MEAKSANKTAVDFCKSQIHEIIQAIHIAAQDGKTKIYYGWTSHIKEGTISQLRQLGYTVASGKRIYNKQGDYEDITIIDWSMCKEIETLITE